jgi:hypothetical protein
MQRLALPFVALTEVNAQHACLKLFFHGNASRVACEMSSQRIR